jgi:hypothetical protein
MKQHLIKEFLPEDSTRDDHESNRYSIYKNPDPKLRKEIKNFKIDTSKVTLGWPEKEWTILEYEDKEVKCQSGRNIQYFQRSEVNLALKENLEYQRNQKYQPHEYFKKHFGIISHLTKHSGYMSLQKIDMNGAMAKGQLVGMGGNFDPTTVEAYETFYEYKVESRDEEITLSADVSGQMMNIYFDANGDYVNRNYNENLNYYVNEDISPDIVMEYFIRQLKKLGSKLQFANGKYYTPKYCIVPYAYDGENSRDIQFGVQLHPVRPDEKSYKQWRGNVIKLPKKLTEVSSKQLIEDVMSKMPPSIKKMFEGTPIEITSVEL